MPVISELKPRRREQWIEVCSEDGELLILPHSLLPAWWIAGFAVPDEEWQRMQRQGQYHTTYDKACRILTRREHFTIELRRKLSERSIDAVIIDEVLKQCQDQGFLNDRRAAELNSEQLCSKKTIGASKLLSELLRKGCDRQLADEMVDRFCAGQDNFSVALELLESRRRNFETKLSQYRRKLELKKSGRQLEMETRSRLSVAMLSFLATRGFTDSDARQAVREFCERLMEAGQS